MTFDSSGRHGDLPRHYLITPEPLADVVAASAASAAARAAGSSHRVHGADAVDATDPADTPGMAVTALREIERIYATFLAGLRHTLDAAPLDDLMLQQRAPALPQAEYALLLQAVKRIRRQCVNAREVDSSLASDTTSVSMTSSAAFVRNPAGLAGRVEVPLIAHARSLGHAWTDASMLATLLDDGDGVHLHGDALRACTSRPIPRAYRLSAACHDAADLAHAERIGVDCVTLSPVQKTQTHPDAVPLGWDEFARLCAGASLPVFALGGMTPADLLRIRAAGGHGVAAIRGLWLGGR